MIQVGYQKGTQQIGENFHFKVGAVEYPLSESEVNHARKDIDFLINTAEVEISFSSFTPANVEVMFLLDDVALESSEVVYFELIPLRGMSLPSGEGIFFQRTVEVLIKNSDSEFSLYICYRMGIASIGISYKGLAMLVAILGCQSYVHTRVYI